MPERGTRLGRTGYPATPVPSCPETAMPDIFQPVDLKAAADRLSGAADKLAQAGLQVRCDIADTGLALIAQGGDHQAQPSEVVPMAQIFNHRKDELAAAADRLIAKVKAASPQVVA